MYHPTGRVLTVLELLQSRPMTGLELADRLECDLRTVRRYVAKLQDVGIPVDSTPGPAGGYRLKPGYRLPPLIFTEDEAAVLLLGLIGTPWLGVALPAAAVESTLSKLSRVLPSTTRDRVESLAQLLVMPLGTGTSLDAGLLLRLTQAAVDSRCVRLDYESREATTRVVEPYGVAGLGGFWYMVGFCQWRQDIRVFRLDRIKTATVLETGFVRPASFDLGKYIQDGLASQRWTVRLRFRASPEAVNRALGTQGTTTATAEGCLYQTPASDLDLLARQLLVARLAFEVVEPQELRDALVLVAEEARNAGQNPCRREP